MSGFYCQSQNRSPRRKATVHHPEHLSAGPEHAAEDVALNGELFGFATAAGAFRGNYDFRFEEKLTRR
ncbi:hypothetical protein [Caballeronia sordidicola]|uniref:hypothetical protein n=1 Tax=Caballeronia sordidicola TaxID=196367 RepID=UPI000B108535|nr:hypothetical protein [Caballeronia sordidicola]